jgi:cytochrome c oxidase subunit 2
MWRLPVALAVSAILSSSLALADMKTFMPPAGTAIASQVDSIYAFLLISSLISFILLIGGFLFFVWKYRRRSPNDKTAYITHNHILEFLWSFIPFCIFMLLFVWGWEVFHEMRHAPENALEVHVYGKKWAWRFLYKNGKEITDTMSADGKPVSATMVVPIGRPVKLILSSEKMVGSKALSEDQTDRPVLHSFFIPAFRIKQDVVPGRYTAEWFKAEKLGDYQVFCAEYCGSGHYSMAAHIKVVSVEDYEKWIASEGLDLSKMSLAERGREAYGKRACIGCHSVDGTRMTGPSFKGLYMSKQELEGLPTIVADEDYLRESILQSNAKITKGFPSGVMPLFAGTIPDDEVTSLIEFIKSVK